MKKEYLRCVLLTYCWLSVLSQNEEEEEETTEDLAEYTLIFQTDSKPGSGTDANVMVRLLADELTTGYPLRYRGGGKKFNTGSEDQINVTDIAYIGPICTVELWTATDLWKLKTLTVVDWKTDDKAVFNIPRLINPSRAKFNRTDKADGRWGQWSDWSVCAGTCPTGSQGRHRSCSRPPPSCGGGECQGEANQTQECPMPDCSKEEESSTNEKASTVSNEKASTVSIIVPIVIAIFIIAIVIAVVIVKRKKKQREELNKKNSEKSEQVVAYDKMHPQGDGTYQKNNYTA